MTSLTRGELAAAGITNSSSAAGFSGRFTGNWYAKLMSVGQAYEWAALDSLRPAPLW
jgi:hypothetical protein